MVPFATALGHGVLKRLDMKISDVIWFVAVVIAAVLANAAMASTVVKVSAFGYDAEDSTRFIQAALDSGARRVVFDRQQGPWITLPVVARSNQEIVFEDGVELQAKKGAFKGIFCATLPTTRKQ